MPCEQEQSCSTELTFLTECQKLLYVFFSFLKALGWVVAYIGANQDVDQVADSLSIDNSVKLRIKKLKIKTFLFVFD